MRTVKKPIAMGSAMGLMMVWMIHSGQFENAALGLVIAHIAAILALIGVGVAFAGWRGVSVCSVLARIHRPSHAHLVAMAGGMGVAASTICITCALGWIEMT